MNYFSNITTIEDLRKEYKRLAILNHPDKGGKLEDMQNINAQYDLAFKSLSNANISNEDILNETEYRQAMEKVASLQGIEIDLVGSWIWVYGNTYPVKSEIKEAGFIWANQKKKWYFRSEENKVKNTKKLSYEEITAKYGVTKIKNTTKIKEIK